jgi:hypothetical protein
MTPKQRPWLGNRFLTCTNGPAGKRCSLRVRATATWQNNINVGSDVFYAVLAEVF